VGDQSPLRSVRIGSPAPLFRRENFFLLDPDKPLADPNELLKLRKGELPDPNAILHNCPICHKTLPYDVFVAHARACYVKWRKVQLDITKKKFSGVTLEAESA
jgi:hypothetical protein